MSELSQKITVIIPAYNIEDLLPKCVKSVADQDYPRDLLQIIVVDDGSTDNTGKVADDLAAEYSNVEVLHKENGGSSSARNLGIEHATGDFIGFVDSDDFVDSHMYSTLVDAAVRNDAEMVQISRDEIAEDGSRLPDVVVPPEKETVISADEQMKRLLLHVGDSSFCTKITTRKIFDRGLRFPEGELNEDFYLMLHALEYVDKLVIEPYQYYHVFYRTGSNSRKKAEDKDYFPSVFTDIVRNADVALELVKVKYPELLPIAERFGYVQRLDYLLHIPISMMNKNNDFYCKVVENIRTSLGKMLSNNYLTGKQRMYLLLLGIAPKFVRKVHARLRGL